MDEIKRIWPQWEVESLIGNGGFGQVYKAKRVDSVGIVSYAAIKVIKIPQVQAEIRDLQYSNMDEGTIQTYFKEMVQELSSEIRIMQSLKSANNIVGIEDYQIKKREDVFEWDIYIRMELLTDLGRYLEQNTLRINDVVRIGRDICNALSNCEKVNIIHRDIKIDNIFVNDFGMFKLGDFGIAKQLEKTRSALSMKGTDMWRLNGESLPAPCDAEPQLEPLR